MPSFVVAHIVIRYNEIWGAVGLYTMIDANGLALAVRSTVTTRSSICVWKPAEVAISGGGSEDHRSAWLLPCSLSYMVAYSSTTAAVSATRSESDCRGQTYGGSSLSWCRIEWKAVARTEGPGVLHVRQPLAVRGHGNRHAAAVQGGSSAGDEKGSGNINVSTNVTLDLAKGVYAKFIDWDEQMFDRETCTPAHSANTAISEDLGQVEYILSDRTGTLTENRMIFRRCCMSDTLYGENNGDALKGYPLINGGTITYQAQSQVEEALVTAASKLNMVLVSKDSNTAEISFNSCKFYYDLLDILEFNSDRKRMSAVVKDVQSGKILLLSKGADEAILPRCHQGTWYNRENCIVFM
uniref:P-type ATPase N-terminal domain-containing protein n=1 Tax=Oryza glumipatula TaxID=40148 RepID=A0A0D9ZXL1_9ORYZ